MLHGREMSKKVLNIWLYSNVEMSEVAIDLRCSSLHWLYWGRIYKLALLCCIALREKEEKKEEKKINQSHVPWNQREICEDFSQCFLWDITEIWAFWESNDDTRILATAPWRDQITVLLCPWWRMYVVNMDGSEIQ